MAAWSPDTCGCRFEFDGALTDYQPTAVRKCPVHAGMSDVEAMKHAHLEINVLKNRWELYVQERAKALYPNELVELNGRHYTEDANGNLKRVPQPDVDAQIAAKTMGYAVTSEGVLEVHLPDMTAEDKAAIEAAVADDDMVQAIKVARPNVQTDVMTVSTKLALGAAVAPTK